MDSCNRMIRRQLWSELVASRNNGEGPFNVTRFAAARANCHRFSGAVSEFSETINDLELDDPPLFGGPYT